MRIENGDGHTWPADVRTHGRGHSAIPSPFCGARGSHLVRFYPDNCGSVPRHSTHHIRTHVCVHGRMGSASSSATALLCKPDVRTESMRAHERMIYRTATGR